MPPANFPKIVGRENPNVTRTVTGSVVEKLSQPNVTTIQINGENLDISKDSKTVSINFPEIPKEIDYTSTINQLTTDINSQNEYIKNTLFILEHAYIKSEDIFLKIKDIEELQKKFNTYLEENNNIYSELYNSIILISNSDNKSDSNIERIQIENKDPDLSGIIDSIDNNFNQLRISIDNILFQSQYESLIKLITNIDHKIDRIELPELPKLPEIHIDNKEIISKILDIKENIKENIEIVSSINNQYEKLISNIKENIEDRKIIDKSVKIRFDNIDHDIKNNYDQLKLEINKIKLQDYSKDLKIINSLLSDINQSILYNNKTNIDNMDIVYKLENKYNYLYSNIKYYILSSLLIPPIWMAIIHYFC